MRSLHLINCLIAFLYAYILFLPLSTYDWCTELLSSTLWMLIKEHTPLLNGSAVWETAKWHRLESAFFLLFFNHFYVRHWQEHFIFFFSFINTISCLNLSIAWSKLWNIVVQLIFFSTFPGRSSNRRDKTLKEGKIVKQKKISGITNKEETDVMESVDSYGFRS